MGRYEVGRITRQNLYQLVGPDIGVVPAMLRLLLSRQPPQPKPEPCHDVRRMDNAPAYLAGQPQVTGPAASCSPAIDLPEG